MNFTKVFIPRQVPCCKTSRPAGWGAAKDARSFYATETRQPAGHSGHSCKCSLTVFRSLTQETTFRKAGSQSTCFLKGGLEKEPFGSAAFRSPSFLILLSNREENGRARTSTESSTPLNTQPREAQLFPKVLQDSSERRRQVGWQQKGGRNKLTGPALSRALRGPARPLLASAHRCPWEGWRRPFRRSQIP